MKKLPILIGGLAMLFISITTVSAMTNSNMSSVLAGLTNKTEEEILELREEKTYGEIARDENVYEEFKQEKITAKIAQIDRKVEEGKLTLEQGEEFKERFLEKVENCDGTKVQMNLGNKHRKGV